jgi:hypothetical protein
MKGTGAEGGSVIIFNKDPLKIELISVHAAQGAGWRFADVVRGRGVRPLNRREGKDQGEQQNQRKNKTFLHNKRPPSKKMKSEHR